jgi:hypothetical protein
MDTPSFILPPTDIDLSQAHSYAPPRQQNEFLDTLRAIIVEISNGQMEATNDGFKQQAAAFDTKLGELVANINKPLNDFDTRLAKLEKEAFYRDMVLNSFAQLVLVQDLGPEATQKHRDIVIAFLTNVNATDSAAEAITH